MKSQPLERNNFRNMKTLLRALKVLVLVLWAVLFSISMIYFAFHYVFTGNEILSKIAENSLDYIDKVFKV